MKNVVVEAEIVKEVDGVYIVGTPDILTDDSVIDIKTTSQSVSKPRDEHVVQVNVYMWMTNRKKGYLVYIIRNENIRIFEVEYDEKLIELFLHHAKKLAECFTKKQAPKPEYGWRCARCQYWERCGIA